MKFRVIFVGMLAGIVASLSASSMGFASGSSSLMDIAADGSLLACTNRDNGTVSVVDLKTNRKLREIAVGKKPEGLTFLGKTHQLAVAVYAEDKVVFADADSGKVVGKVDVFDEPYGIVGTADGSRVYVTLDYPGQVVEIDVPGRKVTRTMPAAKFSRGLAMTPDEKTLLVTEYYTARVVALDIASGKQIEEWAGVSTDNLARQIVIHPTRPKAYVPHIRSRITAVHGEGSIFPYVAVLDLDGIQSGSSGGKSGKSSNVEKKRRKRIPMDAFVGAYVTANPWEAAVSPDGKQFFVVFAGTDDMFVCNVLDDDYKEISHRRTLQLGYNPRAVRVSPDSKRFYVYNALDFEVAAYDATNLRQIASIAVCENVLGEQKLLGKRLFYSALQPMASRRWISCSSCHPDGDPDGRTWHNPEGLRNTQSLAGMAWTHPIHWSADRDEVQDFEVTIRGQLMQGQGLIRGRVEKELGEPNRKLSKALDALASYCNDHKVPLSPYAKKGLSPSAKRGQAIFFSTETKCATCHSGPFYTDSRPVKPFKMHDVGTGNDDPSEKMGPKYDTPTLLGVYRTAPYLHHGKAETLHDVLTTSNRGDRHGKTSHLKKEQIDDLVEFLKALPFEDPEPAAKEAGLTQVED